MSLLRRGQRRAGDARARGWGHSAADGPGRRNAHACTRWGWALLVGTLALALFGLPGAGLAYPATAGDGPAPARSGFAPTDRAQTVPFFTDSFTSGGVTYPYTMVGTNPRTSRATTVVRSVLVPLRFVFADGQVADPGTTAADVVASPIYRPAPFASGVTQYGDAMRRAMFWQDVASTNYHVLLAPPLVLPVQTLEVPAGQGVYLPAGAPVGPPIPPFSSLHTAAPAGVVSLDWFAGGQQPGAFGTLLNRLNLDPQAVAIAVSRNVALSGAPLPFGPPVTGFHTAFLATGSDGIQRVQTAIWADYTDPYPVAEFPGLIANTTVLSHEVAEWLHDPFLSNAVPAWHSPLPLSSFFYGCSHLLETGDAVSEVAFTVDGYQLSDEAFFSWFARESPSRGINGRYTYLGTFTTPSPPC